MSSEQNFRVNLQALVDLLGHHLFLGPGVYLRELVQNSVDAITARRLDDITDHPGHITITPADASPDGRLWITDDGIGLNPEDIRAVLSTIGATSKRDELGFRRGGFLGQFGIGLLSCFMVSDQVDVRTRTADRTNVAVAGEVGQHLRDVQAAEEDLPAQGTVVALEPGRRPDLLHTDAGAGTADPLRRVPARRHRAGHGNRPRESSTRVPLGGPACLCRGGVRSATIALCEDLLGFSPIDDQIELADPESGVRGVAFVQPFPGDAPGRPPRLCAPHAGERVRRLGRDRLGILPASRHRHRTAPTHGVTRAAARGRPPGGDARATRPAGQEVADPYQRERSGARRAIHGDPLAAHQGDGVPGRRDARVRRLDPRVRDHPGFAHPGRADERRSADHLLRLAGRRITASSPGSPRRGVRPWSTPATPTTPGSFANASTTTPASMPDA